ncbi:hypothetical protein HPT29_009680 [Microvirga terrae]|uniref:Uncharacterized protein n=1 Tax=Microvirga terrae TaxID=2740529 RepID=A0ABY5RWM2_9HYPH|nr:hypothetical protein [Microvirga terrae]UVF21368.1 hypothetical protein HPT29_009680 [Microvirga terrae]
MSIDSNVKEQGGDYKIGGNDNKWRFDLATLTDSGRSAVSIAILAQSIHLAWGNGDVAWDASQAPESSAASALIAEVGRRRVTQALYCKPDPGGELVVTEGRFTVSQTPTKYLYLRFAFEFADAADQDIRELGVFIGTTVKSLVPANQHYLLPSDIELPGQLLVLEHIQKLVRSLQVRQQFEFVVQF